MKHVPQRRMKVAHLLTDPKASFVSLVDHGANQVPFSVVKMADMQSKFAGEEGHAGTPMFSGLEVEAMAGKGNVEIQKITFDKSVFTDEEAVKAYLKKAGIDGNIKDEDGLYVVKSDDYDPGADVQVDAEDGVTYSLVKQDEAESEAEDEAAAEADTQAKISDTQAKITKSFLNADMTAEETVQKYDAWWASYNEAKNIQDVLRAGANGLPIGIYELNDAFYTAFRNSLSDGDYSAARAAVTEFGELAVRLAQALEVATVAGAERAAATKAAIIETPIKDAEETPELGVDKPEGGSEKTTETKAEDTEDGDVANSATNEEIGASVVDMIKQAMAPVAEALGEVSKQVTEGFADVRKQVGKAEERVENLERRSQTRKGADVDDAVDGTAPATPEACKVDVLRANTLGFRSRSNS